MLLQITSNAGLVDLSKSLTPGGIENLIFLIFPPHWCSRQRLISGRLRAEEEGTQHQVVLSLEVVIMTMMMKMMGKATEKI
jgi:hypothetical protein